MTHQEFEASKKQEQKELKTTVFSSKHSAFRCNPQGFSNAPVNGKLLYTFFYKQHLNSDGAIRKRHDFRQQEQDLPTPPCVHCYQLHFENTQLTVSTRLGTNTTGSLLSAQAISRA